MVCVLYQGKEWASSLEGDDIELRTTPVVDILLVRWMVGRCKNKEKETINIMSVDNGFASFVGTCIYRHKENNPKRKK